MATEVNSWINWEAELGRKTGWVGKVTDIDGRIWLDTGLKRVRALSGVEECGYNF